uniref:Core shell protein Gag P30 domain-containing protein n=1 Tax=Rousettus aegyptiacus TaxID=9407 RepID=A0A7J8FIL0_ROUAE|nr:hypothetical protein HJG63_011994 [Rousettus aegyptiacus]
MVDVPFSTSDLYNWKHQNPSFSEKPQGLTSLLETIFFTHQLTWDDCQQLLQVLFTSEERERIQREAAKVVLEPNRQPSTDPTHIQHVLPNTCPPWDPNTNQVRRLSNSIASFCSRASSLLPHDPLTYLR